MFGYDENIFDIKLYLLYLIVLFMENTKQVEHFYNYYLVLIRLIIIKFDIMKVKLLKIGT